MRIAYIHPDAEGREKDAQTGFYPRNQLWGADLLRERGHEVRTVQTKNTKGLISRTANLLNKLTRNRFGDFNIELQALKELRKADILYVPSGHLFLLPLLRRLGFIKTKVVTWFFRLPESSRWWSLRNLRFSQYVLNGFDGILCLTRQATTAFSGRTTKVRVKHLSWFADPNIFHSKPSDRSQGYFLCVGKTRRDYPTLLKACSKVRAQFRIIAPDDAAQDTPIPENVKFVKTSENPPDSAISYPELRNWYASAKAILIPLTGDPGDTSGYTALLEAIAMGKPVIMTRSGCLDIDIESLGIGHYVPPKDSEAWALAINKMLESCTMSERAKSISKNQFTPLLFGDGLESFLENI